MRLADSWVLLLLLVPVAGWWLRQRRLPLERLPYMLRAAAVPTGRRVRWQRWLGTLTHVGFALLVIALARPQLPAGRESIRLQSRNILFALDISSSMKARDFKPNRVTAARDVLRQFVLKRDGDLVGLVTFAGRAFLQAPLTADVHLLDAMLERADIGELPDGTGIGAALTMALNQLKNLPPRASCIVLVTDGSENTGKPSLAQATEVARALGIRIHTIGLSSVDTSQIDLNGVWSVRDVSARLSTHDEKVLRRVAERTGGRYARATSAEGLASIMAGIDPLERRDVLVKETRRWHELFPILLGAGLVLLLLERLLSATWLRTLP